MIRKQYGQSQMTSSIVSDLDRSKDFPVPIGGPLAFQLSLSQIRSLMFLQHRILLIFAASVKSHELVSRWASYNRD
jgi:hypothetical protein